MTDLVRIAHPRSEASALLGIQNRSLLDRNQWDFGFWTVSDEAAADEAVSILGRRGDGSWQVESVQAGRSASSTTKAVEDCETMARAGSWIYVFGSQFGSKRGPLQPKRHFVMRFNESLARHGDSAPKIDVDIVRRPFLLHRLINDALRRDGLDMVDATRHRAKKESKSWQDVIRHGDTPINVEGATFLHGGHLLLGLRYPVTVDGHPIVVEIEGIDRFFVEDGLPEVIGFRVLENAGTNEDPTGIRELDCFHDVVHLITGNLDSKAKESAIVADYPQGASAPNEHWIVPLDPLQRGIVRARGKRVRRFDSRSIEGLAIVRDHVWYVEDDEEIVLRGETLNSK
jgi:hypothetical protein